MEIIYKANDGQEFDDEYACITHERVLKEQKLLNNGIIFLDYHNERVYTPIYNFEKIYHIFCPTAESIEILNKIYEDENDDITERFNNNEEIKPNIWYHWDEFENCFESDEYKIKQLQDQIEEYNDILKKIHQEVK